ncbi:MAG: hypothetical protein IPG49_02610 [Proteobacteria bacterium]|nr:hypothetical protein [Pseudomonadota bacterium]
MKRCAGLALLLFTGCLIAAQPPPLALKSMGVFYVGAKRVDSPYSDERDAEFPTRGRTTVSGHAQVTYLIPGVVDVPERSTAGFAVDAINGCIAADPQFGCSRESRLGRTSLEQPWRVWGFGPRFGEVHANSRFPALPLQQNYIEQFGASFEVYMGSANIGRSGAGTSRSPVVDALMALLKRVGPSVLVLHSAAGAAGFEVARQDPARVRALVSIETTVCPALQGNAGDPLAGIAFLGIYGDYVDERGSGGHPSRYRSCRSLAESPERVAAGKFIDLPGDLKVRGNSHLMMQDDNSDDIAALVSDWLAASAIK